MGERRENVITPELEKAVFELKKTMPELGAEAKKRSQKVSLFLFDKLLLLRPEVGEIDWSLSVKDGLTRWKELFDIFHIAPNARNSMINYFCSPSVDDMDRKAYFALRSLSQLSAMPEGIAESFKTSWYNFVKGNVSCETVMKNKDVLMKAFNLTEEDFETVSGYLRHDNITLTESDAEDLRSIYDMLCEDFRNGDDVPPYFYDVDADFLSKKTVDRILDRGEPVALRSVIKFLFMLDYPADGGKAILENCNSGFFTPEHIDVYVYWVYCDTFCHKYGAFCKNAIFSSCTYSDSDKKKFIIADKKPQIRFRKGDDGKVRAEVDGDGLIPIKYKIKMRGSPGACPDLGICPDPGYVDEKLRRK